MFRFIIFFLLCCITGCSTTQLYPMYIGMHASSVLNPDKDYRSLPVIVRLYQLRSNNNFMQANFYELWKKPMAVLNHDFLKEKIITLAPGQQKKLTWTRAKHAKYIAALAIFRKPTRQTWRIIKELPKRIPLVAVRVNIGLFGNKIFLHA